VDLGLAHRTVRCTRVDRLQTLHLRVSEAALRYNSPDCPVCQAEQRSPAQRSTSKVGLQCEQCADSSRRARAAPEGALDSVQCLSGAAPDYPVPQEVRAPTVETVRTLMVGWRGWRTEQCPVAHQTVRCAHRQQPSPTDVLVVGAINNPQPPLFKTSKHSLLLIQYKSNTQHSKTQIKVSDQIKVHNSTLVFRTCEKIDLCSFVALVAWLAFFFLSFLISKPCKRSKRHQLCGGPCGV
jgi:hypothetical protein